MRFLISPIISSEWRWMLSSRALLRPCAHIQTSSASMHIALMMQMARISNSTTRTKRGGGKTPNHRNSPVKNSSAMRHAKKVDRSTSNAMQEKNVEERGGEIEEHHGDVKERAAAPSSTSAEEAYAFLLKHVDTELELLRKQREDSQLQFKAAMQAETRQVQRMLGFIDKPWLLLQQKPLNAQMMSCLSRNRNLRDIHSMVEPLPATALDVFLAEQVCTLEQAAAEFIADSSTSAAAEPDTLDSSHPSECPTWSTQQQHLIDEFLNERQWVKKMHAVWGKMPVTHKSVYEIAAKRNSELRNDMKRVMQEGCLDWNGYCSSIEPWTADRVRKEKEAAIMDEINASVEATKASRLKRNVLKSRGKQQRSPGKRRSRDSHSTLAQTRVRKLKSTSAPRTASRNTRKSVVTSPRRLGSPKSKSSRLSQKRKA